MCRLIWSYTVYGIFWLEKWYIFSLEEPVLLLTFHRIYISAKIYAFLQSIQKHMRWKTINPLSTKKIPYPDGVAPDQPAHPCSLTWELHCPLICRKEYRWSMYQQTVQLSVQTAQMPRLIWSYAVYIWHVTNVVSGREMVESHSIRKEFMCHNRII